MVSMTVHSTISERRHHAEEGLARVGYSVGVDLGSFPAGQQKKIEKLLGELRTLEEIEHTVRQGQIDFYGERAWQGNFTPLAQLEVAPGSRLREDSLRRVVWNALPDGPFKRFQELFVEPADRIVPLVSIQWIGGRQISFAPNFDPKKASVLPCLVSPDRLSEGFLESLGLADFTDLERRPTERLARKASLEVINTLKRAWDGAKPLVERHFRVFVVGRNDPGVDARYDSFPLPEPARGKILVVRRTVEEEPRGNLRGDHGLGGRDLQVQVYDSPGAVLRRIHHLSAGYGRELEILKEIHGALGQVHGALSRWSELDESGRRQLRRRLTETVRAALQQLEDSVDFSKQRAHEILLKATLEDSRSRVNPPRAQLLLMRSVEKIISRLERARSKESFIKIDERAIEALMIESDYVLRDYQRIIVAAAPKLEQRHLLFSPRIRPGEIPGQVRGFSRSLGLEPHDIRRLDVLPYREFGGALATRYGELSAALAGRDRDAAKDALIKMHLVAKLYFVAREIERMKIRIAREPETTLEGIRNGVAGALRVFDEWDADAGKATTRIFPERYVGTLDEPFQLVRDGLVALRNEVDVAGRLKFGGNLSPVAESDRLRALRESLDQFGRSGRYDLLAALRRMG